MEFKRISSIYTSHLEVDDINQELNNYEPTLLKQCSALMHDKRGLLSGTSNNRANSDVINIWINILVIEKMDSSATFRQLCQFDMLAIIKACVISLLIVKYLMNGSTFIYQL